MDSTVFFTTFGLIFLAELGDKTQLTAMALATRYPWKKVFLGIATAFAVLNLGAVLVGKLLFTILPLVWIKLVSGGLFLYFGVTTLRGGGADEDGEGGRETARGPVVTSFLMILLAELGDKTQLVTTSLAAQHDSSFVVFAGSTLALWMVSLLGIFLGKQLIRFVPLSVIHRGAALLFLVFGAAVLYQAYAGQ
ncbi:TMEM165/GDT1 family protein [Geobacter sp.]|uniref:TMEM165/GDT1 family protein n=1 Tax=Geobacter sp. TaxID=46610 RepID=UPI00262F119B|nr:TMEM165/GDT1 family protein [Geobacter sp.]